MNGWYFIAALAVLLLVWADNEIRICDISDGCAKDDDEHSKDAGTLQTVRKAKQDKNSYSYYFSKPKNKIAFATLLAIVWYTILTQREVGITQDQEHRQLRAYISLMSTSLPMGQNSPFEATVDIKNDGTTPAEMVQAKVRGDFLRSDMANPNLIFDSEIKEEDAGGNSSSLGAGGDVILPANRIALSVAEWNSIQPNTKTRLFIFGRVDYYDIFGRPHWTHFCYEFSAENLISGGGSEPCPWYNDTDQNDNQP